MVSMDMSISREDFVRLLPIALGRSPFEEQDNFFTGQDGLRHWEIRLIPLADQCLGSVVLPCHRVEIQFDGYPDEAAEAFMARFHRGFQRGGG